MLKIVGDLVRPFHEQDSGEIDATGDAPERPHVVLARATHRSASLGLTGTSIAVRRLRQEIARIAPSRAPVHVVGESGTGKERVARALHEHGPHPAGPFVAVNCAALERHLLVAEIFGHDLGAFTGATQPRRGLFERAHAGTLFLDEVGELPTDAQAMLLRVLETGEVRRLGSEQVHRVRVRVVTATHRSLAKMVTAGTFRSDLFWRLFVLVLHVSPLRRRSEDVEALAYEILDELSPEVGQRSLHPAAIELLTGYAWPGNIRQLRTVLRRAAASSSFATLQRSDVAAAIAIEPKELRLPASARTPPPSDASLRQAMTEAGGKLATAARMLGLPRTTLRERLRRIASR